MATEPEQEQAADVPDKVREAQSPVGYPNDPNVPDIYADGVTARSSTTSISLVFTRLVGSPERQAQVAVIRVSPHEAKLMAAMLRKIVRLHEKVNGEINFPDGLLKQMGLADDE